MRSRNSAGQETCQGGDSKTPDKARDGRFVNVRMRTLAHAGRAILHRSRTSSGHYRTARGYVFLSTKDILPMISSKPPVARPLLLVVDDEPPVLKVIERLGGKA